MKFHPSLGVAATLLCSLCASCAGGSANQERPNLLVIVVDTLRRDHLEPYGYSERPTTPRLSKFAQESLVVRGLTSVSSWTQPSMATLFTGLTPADHDVLRLFDRLREPNTLAFALQSEGYATACVMSNFLLQGTWRGLPTGYARGFDEYDAEVAAKPAPHSESTAHRITAKGLRWLKKAPQDRPWFMLLHYFDPHVVYEAHPAYGFSDETYEGWVRAGLSSKELRAGQSTASDADRAQLAAFYDGEIRAVDDALGTLLDALQKRPDWKDTIVVFTADHGEELAERGTIGHTVSLHFEQIDLPLVVKLPGSRRGGETLDARVPQEGLFATLLELCGASVPEGRGESFAALLTGDETVSDRPCFSEVDFQPANVQYSEKVTRMRSVIAQGFKLMRDLEHRKVYLYDLERDPEEYANVAEQPEHADVRAELTRMMRERRWAERRR